MVISLCWKVGSSETGLTCMKEITKIYKEGHRVGYAQLSPGTDLYVCPRSDTIITILAKYGFFKGMAAVEEDQDSLIGCVVWRRNLAPSGAKARGSKKFSSEDPSDSPTKESDCQTAEPISTLASTHESMKSQSILRSEDNTCKHIPMQPMAPSVPENKITSLNSSIDATLPVDFPSGYSMNMPEMQVKCEATFSPTILPAGFPTTHLSAFMKPDSDVNNKLPLKGLELQQGTQNKHNPSDDDDLPEFDFDAACGAPRALRGENSWFTEQPCLNVIQHNEQLNIEQSKNLFAVSKPSEKNLSFKVSDIPSKFPVVDVPGKIADNLPKKAAAQTTEAFSKSAMRIENDIFASQGFKFHGNRKKIWDDGDDDDDMPEWCPPDMNIGESPSSPPLLPHHPFHPSRCGIPEIHPAPPGPPLPVSQLQQRQQTFQNHQGRTALPHPKPSRLPDHHLVLGHEFSQQSPAMSKYSCAVDRGRHQTPISQMPSVHCRSSKCSPPWSPSSKNRFQSTMKRDYRSPVDRRYAEEHDWRNSREDVSGKPLGNRHDRSCGKPDRYCDDNPNETKRGKYSDLDRRSEYQRFSPKCKTNEFSRHRTTGFDILPDSPRPSLGHDHDHYPRRRRPSLFDIKPRVRSSHRR